MKQKNIISDWPKEELEPVPQCPACGNRARILMYSDLTDRVFHCAPGTWNLYRCQECKSAYLDPRPTPASISRAYSEYYTHQALTEGVGVLSMNIRQRIRRALRNGYVNNRFNAKLEPASMLGKFIIPLLYGKKGQIDHSYRSLPKLDKSGGRVLDIGCGNGDFLRAAAEIGWEAWGVDPDPVASAQTSGYKVLQGKLPDIDLPDNYFDVVTLSHVIEHVHDPVASLKEIQRLLKPGGTAWLATPNLESYGQLYFKQNYINLDPPRHLILFTRDSIMRIVTDVGFRNALFCSMHPQATNEFIMSHRVVSGEKPFASKTVGTPVSLKILAKLADVFATIIPERRELIVLTATKPLKPQQSHEAATS